MLTCLVHTPFWKTARAISTRMQKANESKIETDFFSLSLPHAGDWYENSWFTEVIYEHSFDKESILERTRQQPRYRRIIGRWRFAAVAHLFTVGNVFP